MVIIIDSQIAGISGDMLLCALVDLGASQSKILDGINTAQRHVQGSVINHISFTKKKKHGIGATCLDLDITEVPNQHRKGTVIKQCLEKTICDVPLSPKAKQYVVSCIDTLISAESKIHDEPIDSVHFHEAASIDTVIDILGTAIALDDLRVFNNNNNIISTAVCVGGGTIDFSHGTTSNPASAILEIFKNSGITICGGMVPDELTTPTGASLLVNLKPQCVEFYPSLEIQSIGYGGGTKDFESFANVLKIVKGVQKESVVGSGTTTTTAATATTTRTTTDSILVLDTNVDDVTGEVLGSLIDDLMSNGAKDVMITSGITKKNRPTNLVTVLCDDTTIHKIIDIITLQTGTLGVRVRRSTRFVIPRTTVSVALTVDGTTFDNISYKINPTTGKILKIEFDDIKRVSDGLCVSVSEAQTLIKNAIIADRKQQK